MTLAVLALVAAAVTAGIDEVFLARVRAGTDNALRLAAFVNYVGVDGSYTLARALGIAALVLAYAAVVLGLIAAEQRQVRGWPSPLLGVAHRQAGLMTLVLVAGHVAVPFTSVFAPYQGWPTALVPFDQPVSWGIRAATWESFGILAFYLAILAGPTFYLLRRRPRWWIALHRVTLVVYVLSAAHAFLLGTDFLVSGPARVALLAAQVPLLVLAGRRVARSGMARVPRRLAGGVVAATTGGLTVLSVLVATGTFAGGMRL